LNKKKFITGKSIAWYIMPYIDMFFYYLFINWGLMKVQGLDFYYLWNTGGGGGVGH